MMTRRHLQYRYFWSGLSDVDQRPIFTTPTMLDRSDGYCVLRFINNCATALGMSPEDRLGYKGLEVIVQEFVPPQLVSCNAVKKWIEDNYKWHLIHAREHDDVPAAIGVAEQSLAT